MGGASVALAGTGEAMSSNPAGLWLVRQRQISFFYSRPFGLAELETATGTWVEPTGIGHFGVRAEAFGFELYREMTVGITWANVYRGVLAYGTSMNLMRASVEGGGSDQTVGLDAGMLFAPHPMVRTGFFTTNLNAPKLGAAHEELPRTLSAGLAFIPAQDLLFSLEAYKDVRFKTSIRAGTEYRPVAPLVFRAGWATDPGVVAGGFGVSWGAATVDYAVDVHPVLGTTHYVQFTLNIGSEKAKHGWKEGSPGI